MASELLFPYNQLNLAFFISKERKTIYKTGLLEEEVVEIFEYRKNNNKY